METTVMPRQARSRSRSRSRSIAVALALLLTSVMILTAGCALSGSSRGAPFAEKLGLRSARVAHRATLAEHRKQQIARLHTYADAGVFPYNPLPSSMPVHIFKDMYGTRCAVANLVYLDGLGDVVDRMAKERNDVVVADEASGSLHDWVLTSGLTNEEVRRIQGVGFLNDLDGIGLPIARTNEERERMQGQLRLVEKELLANTDASLEIASSRFEGTRLALR